MKLISKFDTHSWNRTYGSLWCNSRLTALTGDIQFHEDRICIETSAGKKEILFDKIVVISKKKYPLLGYHIYLQTDSEMFVLMLPNPSFYLKKITSLARRATLVENFEITFFLKLNLTLLPLFYFFSLPIMMIAVFEKTIDLNLVFYPNLYFFLLVATYLTWSTFSARHIPNQPTLKLLVFTWLVPVIGLFVVNTYLYRFGRLRKDVTPRNMRGDKEIK